MPRTYLGGWYYAFKALSVSLKDTHKRRRKLKLKVWKKRLKSKFYWKTSEEWSNEVSETLNEIQENAKQWREHMEDVKKEYQESIKDRKFDCYELTGVVQTDGLTHDEFLDAVIDWVESKGWSYGGAIRSVDDDAYDEY